MEKVDTIEIGRAAISRILSRFPNLIASEAHDDPVELSFRVPKQDGLQHDVWLGLLNFDELAFSVSNFQCEWFPCTQTEQVEHYVDAVTGWLSGRHRILEHYSVSQCVKAELQAHDDGDWKTLATWSVIHIPLPFGRSYKVLTNRA